jgi:hypothetical protein
MGWPEIWEDYGHVRIGRACQRLSALTPGINAKTVIYNKKMVALTALGRVVRAC